MPEVFSQDQLRRAAEKHLHGGGEAAFSRITTGKFNTSYYVSSAAGEYVIRIAPPPGTPCIFYEREMMKQEPGIHALLLAKTDVPVAPIVAFDQTREVLPSDFLLMRRLPGRAASESALSRSAVDRLFEQTGKALAAIHAQEANRYGYLGEHRCMEPQHTWKSAFIVMWNKLLDDIEGTDVYATGEIARMRGLLADHLSSFDHEVRPQLLHMDIWAQNLLCDASGNLTGLVDFDRALWGDPQIEYAVLDYCGVSTPAFWKGYGAQRPSDRDAGIRHRFYYLYELQKYVVIEALRHSNRRAADGYREHALSLANEFD